MIEIKKLTGTNSLSRKPKAYNGAFGYVSKILHDNKNFFNSFFENANREYIIVNKKKMRGFALVRNTPNEVVLELLGTNQRPNKKPPAGQKGWGRQLMNEIRKNAGQKVVRIHDPVLRARGFYKHLGYNTASNTTGGTSTMKRKPSPNVTSKRRLSPIRENEPSPKRVKSSPQRSPRSPRSASARASPSK